MTSVLRLPEYLSPTLNQWQRLHYRARAREKKRVMDHIAVALLDVPGELWFDGYVNVLYTRLRRAGPPMDHDNLCGSFKPIGDALESMGVVWNDSRIILHTLQRRVEKGDWWGTLLEFYEG